MPRTRVCDANFPFDGYEEESSSLFKYFLKKIHLQEIYFLSFVFGFDLRLLVPTFVQFLRDVESPYEVGVEQF